MKKTIILVEDELVRLKQMLLSIQALLLVASHRRLFNAPKENDTEVCVLHVIGEGQVDEEPLFLQFKSRMEEREYFLRQENHTVPIINYIYEPVQICRADYPDNCNKCSEVIGNAIRKLTNQSDCAILLDVVLDKKNDTTALLNNNKILSQLLYQDFYENCIPYTRYDSDSAKFRQKWAEGVTPNKVPYERFCIEGRSIYKPFRDDLYKRLKIGDDVNE